MSQARNVSLFDVDDVTGFGPVRDMTVTRVSGTDVDEFCRRWHYSNTGGSMSWRYGLWDGYTLVGVVAYNLPTMPVCESVFGPEMWDSVCHMGRLVCADEAPRNVESRLIAESLRMLKKDKPQFRAVLTFAATGEGHIGYVYQATNALYCGITTPRHYYMDQQQRRRAPKQGTNLSIGKATELGWTVHYETGKHRYIYLLGSKTERKEAMRLLRYTPQPYPKAARHD